MEKSEMKFQFDGPVSMVSHLPTWVSIGIADGEVRKVFCDVGNNVGKKTYPYPGKSAAEIREALAPALAGAGFDDIMRALEVLNDADIAYTDALNAAGAGSREEDFPLVDLPSLAAEIKGAN